MLTPLSIEFLARALPDIAPHAIARVLGPASPSSAQHAGAAPEADVELMVTLVCEISGLAA